MIEINLYADGFEVKEHAQLKVCWEVSILSWSCTNSIYYLDTTSQWKSSNGYTSLKFDTNNGKALFVFNEFKRNLQTWAKKNWPESEVKIEEIGGQICIV